MPQKQNQTIQGLRFTDEAMKKAFNEGNFIRVVNESKASSTRKMSSAMKKGFTEGEIFIMNDKYRLTGTPENIRLALLAKGESDNYIRQLINDAITVDNYENDKFDAFRDEVLSAAELKSKRHDTLAYEWEYIMWFGANVKDATIVKEEKDANGVSVLKTINNCRTKTKDIRTEYNCLKPGQVMDVSNIDPKVGTGYKKLNKAPIKGKFTGGSTKIYSNNENNFIAAMRLIHGDQFEEHKDEVETFRLAYNASSVGKKAKKSSKQSKGLPSFTGLPQYDARAKTVALAEEVVFPTSPSSPSPSPKSTVPAFKRTPPLKKRVELASPVSFETKSKLPTPNPKVNVASPMRTLGRPKK